MIVVVVGVIRRIRRVWRWRIVAAVVSVERIAKRCVAIRVKTHLFAHPAQPLLKLRVHDATNRRTERTLLGFRWGSTVGVGEASRVLLPEVVARSHIVTHEPVKAELSPSRALIARRTS